MDRGDFKRSIAEQVCSIIKPPKRLKLSESAELNLIIKDGSNDVAWDAEQAAYMIEPMNMIKETPHNLIAFVAGARTGKTVALLLSPIIDSATADPADIIIVHTKNTTAEAFSKKEVSPALSHIKPYLSTAKTDNNILNKFFKNRANLLITTPVEDNFRGKSAKYGLITELDALPECNEGSWHKLLMMRTKSHGSRGTVVVESSPAFDAFDPDWLPSGHQLPPALGIVDIYNKGDRRQFYWKCPHCEEYFNPEPRLLNHDFEAMTRQEAACEGDLDVACSCCGSPIKFEHRKSMNPSGLWVPEGCEIKDGKVDYTNKIDSYPSYWLSPLCAQFYTWEDLKREHLMALAGYESTGSDKDLRTYFNTVLGMPYTPPERIKTTDQLPDENKLALNIGQVPDDVIQLIATVDCQGGKNRRFEVAIWGVRVGGGLHLVDRYGIRTVLNKNGVSVPIEPHKHVEHCAVIETDILNKEYQNTDYIHKVALVVFDAHGEAGYNKTAADFFHASKNKPRLMPLKGANALQDALVKRAEKPQVQGVKKVSNFGNSQFLFNVHELKNIASVRLTHCYTDSQQAVTFPADLSGDYYAELLSETSCPIKGTWSKKKVSQDNETWDLLVYAIGAIEYQHIYQMKKPNPKYSELKEEFEYL